MDDIQRRLRIVVSDTTVVFAQNMPLSLQTLRGYAVMLQVKLPVPQEAQLPTLAVSVGKNSESKRFFSSADANIFPSIYDLFDPSLLPSAKARLVLRSPQSRRAVMKLDDEVKGRCVAVYEVGEIVEKGLSVMWLRMEEVVLSPATIVLAALEERKQEEEGERFSRRLRGMFEHYYNEKFY
ncbi:uncharacterized protein MONOS_11164 [Monocercomonoides exilis]|uniref:uncharacterized protein n=1 Tax=Monocercomonoides exilis TaxID=2049356 RepID=UPI00355A26A8|nr:hypothetical protein MONOS_11164 [Monocercomonoides exilis]|eukprot:MONOS_11164.1-p1 / transcript=MONOS_11164.1 / gene=MONOS_11164 / organism=Monocercomonoides_exilis_PA203 / gene_product=unspecified product / transcript_product=unspecified product / location=Mono_scaffold00545:38385-38979(+) / protein_length=181 / sequence_SO=supercontig / SO=protein_coding / is_pseudo=false